MFTPLFAAGFGIEMFPELFVPALAEKTAQYALALLEQALSSTGVRLISEAANLWSRIISVFPQDHSDQPKYLSNLSVALREL
jgi:hypothetical protein